MLQIALIKIALALVIAFAYMLFDVFNERNVPDVFAFGTLLFAAAAALFGATSSNILTSYIVAAMICGLGYILYKIGEIGAADIIELAALVLLIPLQPVPFLSGASQLGFPFAVSLIVDTGIAAVIMVPLYYIPKAFSLMGKSVFSKISRSDLSKALVVVIAYALFFTFIATLFAVGTYGLIIFASLMVFSSLMLLFQNPITLSMVKMASYSEFTEGDIIAFNLMRPSQIIAAKRKISNFGRLVTPAMISEMKSKKINTKFPLYKNAVPLAVAIFAGLVFAILFGNMVLLMFR
jgi:Flp pilus assembly protein protease CpaA